MLRKRSQANGTSGSSQCSQPKRTKLAKNEKSVRPGKVSKITLKNFMCHSLMKVDFNPNINFIIGRNGSGKSAILTALIIALGGKASDTNRSTSLKEFIKKGCPSTTIEVELLNDGDFPYKPEEFGKVLTISRQLFATGRNVYKILSESGTVISTKRADVLRITTGLKIMVDNPLSVLTQDTARTFLNSSDPKKKYIFFTKATSLDFIKKNIDDIASVINKSDENMEKYHEDHDILQKEVNELEQQLAQFKSIDDLKKAKDNIEKEMQWCQITALEQEKEMAENQLKQKGSEVEDMTKSLEERENVQKNLEKKKESMKKGLDEKKKETENLANAYKELRAKERAEKDTYQQKLNDIKMLKSKISRSSEQKVTLAQEIEEQQKHLSMWDVRKAERDEKIKSLLAKEKELKDLCSVTQMDLSAYFGNNAKLQDDIERLNGSLRQINGKIHQTTSLIKQLDSKSNNALSLYGAHIPSLVDMIKKAHASGSFTELPRGPLGNYIEIREKTFASAIEQTLGQGFLRGFSVTNAKDRETLIKIIQKNFPNLRMPMIITSRFIHKVHNISQTKAQSDSRTGIISLLDAIRITDPVVANIIIDQLNAEQILLSNSEDVAMQLMSVEERVPDNCRRMVVKDGTTYYPSPNYKVYSGNDRPSQFLQISIKERQMQLKVELEGYQQEVTKMERNLHEKQIECESTQREMDNLKRKIGEYQQKARQVLHKLQELKDEEEPAQGNIDSLKEELEIMEKGEIEWEEKITESQEELTSIKCLIDGFGENLIKAKAAMRESESGCLVIQEKIDALSQSMGNMQGSVIAQRIRQMKAQMEEIAKQISSAENTLSELMNTVDENSRPTTLRTMPCLKSLLQDTKTKIKRVMALDIDPEKVQKEYDQKLEKMSENQEVLDDLQTAVNKLIDAANLRHKVFVKLRKHMSGQVQHYFMFMLKMRNYEGNIEINHKEGTLTIEVDPGHNSSENNNESKTPKRKSGFRDLRSLSGGERSYSTVSFLIALWNCMNLPFYFLDEFDVFMDHMNRKIIMDVLLQSAHENPHKQYVFLTPQDTSTIHATDMIKIHKMADPER